MVKLEKVKKQYKDFELDCSVLWRLRRAGLLVWSDRMFQDTY